MSNQNLGIAPAVALATIGPIVAKAQSIIKKVAPLLQNVFSSKATKALKAQKGEYDQANTQLRSENAQLDTALRELQSQGQIISQQMRQLGVIGLSGIDGYQDLGNIFRKIIDAVTGKTKATNQLNNAKATYEQLSIERDQKLSAANDMIQQINTLQQKLQNAVSAQNQLVPGVNNIVLAGGVLAASALGYYVYNNSKKPKKAKA